MTSKGVYGQIDLQGTLTIVNTINNHKHVFINWYLPIVDIFAFHPLPWLIPKDTQNRFPLLTLIDSTET